MNEPNWLNLKLTIAVHDMQLVEHGGPSGIRDQGLLESALTRPQQIFAYALETNVFELATAYAYGILSNHPFVDGNKRTALIAAYTFLGDNGWELEAPEAEAAIMVEQLAADEVSEEDFSVWLHRHSVDLHQASVDIL